MPTSFLEARKRNIKQLFETLQSSVNVLDNLQAKSLNTTNGSRILLHNTEGACARQSKLCAVQLRMH